jgi:hypothetical protein
LLVGVVSTHKHEDERPAHCKTIHTYRRMKTRLKPGLLLYLNVDVELKGLGDNQEGGVTSFLSAVDAEVLHAHEDYGRHPVVTFELQMPWHMLAMKHASERAITMGV